MSKHLSPTTFIRYRKCPHQVKLEKIDKVLGEERGEQTLAMATGNLFDIAVKSHINRRVDRAKESALKVPSENMRKSANLVVEEIWNIYRLGAYKALQEEGIAYEGVDKETVLEWNGKESICYGMPDLVMRDGTVIDWKVSGAFGRGATPVPGFVYEHHLGKRLIGNESPPPMNTINEDWAIQLYLYARLLGHHPGTPLKGGIEQICVKDNDVRCVSYRSAIPEAWQLVIEEEFHLAYFNLYGGGTVPKPHYHRSRCMQYGKVCAVAQHCEAWKRFQEFKDS